MLELHTQKEVNDIFTYFASFKPHLHAELSKLKKRFLKHVTIKQDDALEAVLDDLQNELAELEEAKDDLLVKLAFYRKDSTEELRRAFQEMNYASVIGPKFTLKEEMVEAREYVDQCTVEDLGDFVGDAVRVVEKAENLLKNEIVSNNDGDEGDGYKVAMNYFMNLD